MDKHKCKLCFRNFSNGRALGGHMRSHMMNLPVPRKPEDSQTPPPPPPPPPIPEGSSHVSDEIDWASYSEEEDDGGGEGEKGLNCGKPKRSITMVDPEFAFAVDSGCVVVQDRKSETVSSKNPNRTRGRSRKIWRSVAVEEDHQIQPTKKLQSFVNPSKTESWAAEPEPASSISDATTEDVAFCLIMLSRDQWKRQKDQVQQKHCVRDDAHDDEEEEDHDEAEGSFEESDESADGEELKSTRSRLRGKYRCETCNKVFRSYQALGGHRASHKKIKITARMNEPELEEENAGIISAPMADKKIHVCPVCFRIFSSGQGLGGHKRTHVLLLQQVLYNSEAPVS